MNRMTAAAIRSAAGTRSTASAIAGRGVDSGEGPMPSRVVETVCGRVNKRGGRRRRTSSIHEAGHRLRSDRNRSQTLGRGGVGDHPRAPLEAFQGGAAVGVGETVLDEEGA